MKWSYSFRLNDLAAEAEHNVVMGQGAYCQGRSKTRPLRRSKSRPLLVRRGCFGLRGVWCLERSGRHHIPRNLARVGGAGWLGVEDLAFAPALLQTEAVAVHLEDVDVVSEAVEQSAGEPFRAEDFGPFGEGQVAGDQG